MWLRSHIRLAWLGPYMLKAQSKLHSQISFQLKFGDAFGKLVPFLLLGGKKEYFKLGAKVVGEQTFGSENLDCLVHGRG